MAGTRNQVEGLPWYRCARAVGIGVDLDAMDQIDTDSLVDRARCLVSDTPAGAVYEYDQDSVAAADGFNVLAPSSNVGRWMLSAIVGPAGAPLFVAPTDWTTFMGIVNAQAALGRAVQMGPGTWTCDAAIQLASGATIYGGPEVNIVCALGYTGVNVFNAPFFANVVASGVDTTLAATASLGASTVSSNASYAAGSYVSIETTTLRRQYYQVKNVSGAGPYTLTLDRPLCEAWPSGAVVHGWTSIPRNIRINGGGMHVSGTADRYFEFGGTWDSEVADVAMDTADGALGAGSLAASWDIGCLRCRFLDCTMDSYGTSISGGFAMESCEQCHIIRCAATNIGTGGAGAGHAVYDSWFCTTQDCSGAGGFYGVAHTGNAGEIDCEIRGGTYFGNTIGVLIGNGQRSRLNGVAAINNGTGVKLHTEDDPKMVACSMFGNTTDLDIAVTNLVMPLSNQYVSLAQAASAIIIDESDELAALLQLSPVMLLYVDPRRCTRVATKCSAWLDGSATGFDVTQGVDGNRPVYMPRNTAYGNRPTLNFTNASAHKLVNAGNLGLAQPYWVLGVGHCAFDTSGFMDSAAFSVYGSTTTTQEHLSLYAGSTVIGAGARVDIPRVFAAEYNGASSKGWAGQYTTPQVTGSPGAGAISSVQVGGGVITNSLTGSIGLLAVFAGTSTTAQRKLAMRLAGNAFKLTVAAT